MSFTIADMMQMEPFANEGRALGVFTIAEIGRAHV